MNGHAMKALFTTILLIAAINEIGAAQAKVVEWVLSGVEWDNNEFQFFQDGHIEFTPLHISSYASGRFFYDASSGEITQWSIDVNGYVSKSFSSRPEACIAFPVFHCDRATRSPGPAPGTDTFHFAYESTPGGTSNLYLVTPSLTDQGGTVALSPSSFYSCCYSRVGGPVTVGRLIAVPEAGSVAWLTVALGLFIASRQTFRHA